MNDRQRCERLYRAHAHRVHAYARRRSDEQTADDVVAEVFLIVWRRLDAVPADPLPWLLGVARKALANHRRSSARSIALNERIGATLPSHAEQPAQDHEVLEALAMLEPRDREVLLLIAWEGLRQDEVATVLAINRPAVATRLHRARRRLAQILDAHEAPAFGRGGMPR